MKIFTDAELKNELTTIDFGIVKVGETKINTYYLFNDSGTEVRDINVAVDNKKEVSVQLTNTSLPKSGSTPFTLTYTPTLEIKKGLNTQLQITANEIYS